MLLDITYIDLENIKQTMQINLESDDMIVVENFLIEQLGYYPNSVDINRIDI